MVKRATSIALSFALAAGMIPAVSNSTLLTAHAEDVIVTSDCGGLEPDETTFAGGDG